MKGFWRSWRRIFKEMQSIGRNQRLVLRLVEKNHHQCHLKSYLQTSDWKSLAGSEFDKDMDYS